MDSDIRIDFEHPNKGPAEYFINHTGEEFVEEPVELKDWKNTALILKMYSFKSVGGNTHVHILFFDTQKDAIALEAANDFWPSDTFHCVLNGSVLYVIEGDDKKKISHLTGLFAGEE